MEGRNFDIRKHVLQYDDVMNQQRELIYAQRDKVLEGESLRDNIISMIDSVVEKIVSSTAGDARQVRLSWETMSLLMMEYFGLRLK